MKRKGSFGTPIYDAILEFSKASVVITDHQGIVEYVNAQFTETTGYSLEEIVGKRSICFESSHHSDEYYGELWGTVSSGKIWKGELTFPAKDGALILGNALIKPVQSTSDDSGKLLLSMQLSTPNSDDIISISRRERILNDIQSLSKTGGWEYDVKTDSMYWTDELYRIHGFQRPFTKDHIKSSIQCYSDEDRPFVEKAFNNCLLKGKDYDLTVGFTDVLGNKKWLRTKSSAIKDKSGNVEKILGSVKDVTEEVGYEQALKAGENRLRDVVQSFDDIVVMYDTGGRHSEIYGKWASDQDLRDRLIGKTAVEALGEKDGEVHREALKMAFKEGSFTYNWSYEDRSGITYYQMKLSTVRNSNGKITGILGASRNITAEVEAAEGLRNTKARLSRALEGTQAGMWDWYLPNGRLDIDDQWAKLLGYKKEELTPCTIDTWAKLTHKHDSDTVLKKAGEAIKNVSEKMFETQFRMRHKNGRWVWILSRGKITEKDQEGRPVRLTGTHIDISKRKHAEQERIKSEKRYRDLFTKSSDANLLVKEGVIFDCNKAAVRLLGYGKKTSLIGKSPLKFSPEIQPDGRRSAILQEEFIKKLKKKRSITFDWYLKRKKGELFPVDVVVTAVSVDDGKQAGYVVLRDITDRVQAEEALKNSLREKSALLSEVHHRVKNNLAVISGLMQLQVYKSESEENTKVLRKSIDRIRSIALIHEQLYASENFSRLSLKSHIVKQVGYIQDLFKEQEKNIRVELDLDDVYININQALPVGLMINEILTNAFKYAFRKREKGIIHISLRKEEGYINILISDDGVGVEGDISKDKSLGVNLIEIFAEQLEATLDVETKNGVSYDIRFKEREFSGFIENDSFV
jgi:PAS domain S-box-containing protein